MANIQVGADINSLLVSNQVLANSKAALVALGASTITNAIDVTAPPYNAVGDGRRADGIAIMSGTATLTSTNSTFTVALATTGKYIRVEGAGTAGADLITTIAIRSSDTQVTLAANAVTSINSPKSAFWGTGNTEATGVAITIGSAILTSTNATFTAASSPAGKAIRVVGAGVAGADLTTTILSRQSDTQVTINANASTTVNPPKSAFWGTNNTTAIQTALDAALNTTSHREVLIPKGAFLCNVRLPSNVKLRGIASSSLDVNVPNCAPTWDANSHPSILLPAISTSPVVLVGTAANASTTGFGSEMSNLSIIGSVAKVGDGFRGGNAWDDFGGVFNTGNNRLHQLWVGGFENGISFGRAVEPLITLCFVHSCTNAFSFSAVDNADVTACYTSNTTKSFRLLSCKTFALGTGSYDDTQKVMEITDSNVNIRSINTERVSVSAFDILPVISGASNLNIDQVMCLTHAGPFIRNHATEATRGNVKISVRNAFSANDYVTINSQMPDLLPAGIKIVRHADTGFATPTLTRFSDDLYYSYRQSNAVQGNMTRPRMQTLEKFVKVWAEPYGELGWTRTILGGSWAGSGNDLIIDPNGGGLRFTSSSAPSSMRFTINQPWIYDPKDVLIGFRAGYIGAQTSGTTRLGFYAKDTLPTMTPLYGYGLKVSRAAGDTVVYFESITNGTITPYATTIPHTAVTNAKFTLYIRVTDAKVYLSLFDVNGALQVSEQSFARPTSGSNIPYAPAFFLGAVSQAADGLLYEMWMEDSN